MATIKEDSVSIMVVGLTLLSLVLSSAPAVQADELQQGDVGTRGLPQIQRPMQPGMPVQPSAGKAMQEPSWPQKFDVRGPETDGFGFAVTQPGPIIIDVQSQGPPITVTLRGPGVPPHAETGAGHVRLIHQVTAHDVARGLFWGVSIGLQQPGPTQAVGQVTVQHPPANPAQVQAAAAAQQQAVQQQAAQRQAEMQQAGVRAAAQMEAAFQQRRAQFEQQRQHRHATLMAQAQPMIDRLRMRGPGQVRTRGIEGDDSAPAEATAEGAAEVETRGFSRVRPSGPFTQATPSAPPMVKIPETQTNAPSQQMQTTSSALTYMPDPIITSLSVAQGQPGDPVLISGNGFGDEGGEIHFVIGPGKDLIAPAGMVWRNDQIFATVPEATGVLGFNGTVYLQRVTDKKLSNLVPFRFDPEFEYRTLKATTDRRIGYPGSDNADSSFGPSMYHSYVKHFSDYLFWGHKGNDEFLINARLRNGWIFDDVYLTIMWSDRGGAYIQEKKIGTDWPYFNIRFWVDASLGTKFGSRADYIYLVSIKGPKGVPDGLIMP